MIQKERRKAVSNLPFFGTPKLLSSAEAEAGADRLLQKIRAGSMVSDVLPGSCPGYTGQPEEKDYVSYCRFLSSPNGRKLIRTLEAQDDRKGFCSNIFI